MDPKEISVYTYLVDKWWQWATLRKLLDSAGGKNTVIQVYWASADLYDATPHERIIRRGQASKESDYYLMTRDGMIPHQTVERLVELFPAMAKMVVRIRNPLHIGHFLPPRVVVWSCRIVADYQWPNLAAYLKKNPTFVVRVWRANENVTEEVVERVIDRGVLPEGGPSFTELAKSALNDSDNARLHALFPNLRDMILQKEGVFDIDFRWD